MNLIKKRLIRKSAYDVPPNHTYEMQTNQQAESIYEDGITLADGSKLVVEDNECTYHVTEPAWMKKESDEEHFKRVQEEFQKDMKKLMSEEQKKNLFDQLCKDNPDLDDVIKGKLKETIDKFKGSAEDLKKLYYKLTDIGINKAKINLKALKKMIEIEIELSQNQKILSEISKDGIKVNYECSFT